jgi:transposase InsO family protein
MNTAEDFHQLKLRFIDPLQHDYEVIRPILLFSESVAERSRQTDIARTTINEKAGLFVKHGMLGLQDRRTRRAGRKPSDYPEPIIRYILYLKHIYPPMSLREIERILKRKFGYKTNHHTLQRFLDRNPTTEQLEMPFKTFHDFDDAYQARFAVVRMAQEGWNHESIAACLKLSRRHVGRIVAAFEQDSFQGLEDKRHRAPDHPKNQLTLPLIKEILDIQNEYPDAGQFRVRSELKRRRPGKVPSEATIGRAMAKNRSLHGAPNPRTESVEERDERVLKTLKFRPEYPHQYWFMDLRYLVKIDGKWTYSICILEGWSRKLLAGMASEHQDLLAILQLLAATLREYGCPGGIVTDNGSVFTSHIYRDVLQSLDITICYIDAGKPWQNLIEAQFKIQSRIADKKFAKAKTIDDIQTKHAAFVETFNTTSHWAHRQRPEEEQTPEKVLGQALARTVDPDHLLQTLRHVQLERVVSRAGYVSIQRFCVYAERGLARQRVSIWLYEGRLHIEYEKTLVARYKYRANRKSHQITAVDEPSLFKTPFASPQLELWELDEIEWRKVLERSIQKQQKRLANPGNVQQLALPLAGLILWCFHLFHVQRLSHRISTVDLGDTVATCQTRRRPGA